MKSSKILRRYTNAINKKGELKGSNKKETKSLRGGCVHHKYNKHGNPKATIFINDGSTCNCTLCKGSFPAVFYDNKSIHDIVDEMVELNNHNKYIAVASNAGEEVVEYFSMIGSMLAFYPKNSKKVRNVAQKQDNVKKKKKHHNGGGSSAYGSWNQK